MSTTPLAKPPNPIIDRANPLSKQLLMYCPFNWSYSADLLSPSYLVPPPRANRANGAWGEAYYQNDDADASGWNVGTRAWGRTDAIMFGETWMVAFSSQPTGVGIGMFAQTATSLGLSWSVLGDKMTWARGSSGGGNKRIWTGLSAFFDDKPHVLIVKAPSNANAAISSSEAYVDGIPLTVFSTSTGNASSGIGVVTIGQTSGSIAQKMRFGAFGMWGRALSYTEIVALSLDPFAPIRPARSRRSRTVLTLPFNGYNLYRGPGKAISNIDWTTPVARFSRQAVAGSVAGLGHTEAQYTYALRPVRNDLVTPDIANRTLWNGPTLTPTFAAVQSFSAGQRAGGAIRTTWYYRTPTGQTAFTKFRWYSSTDGTFSAYTEIIFVGDGPYEHTLAAPQTARPFWFAVRPVDASGNLGDLVSVGPVMADPDAPVAPTIVVGSSF